MANNIQNDSDAFKMATKTNFAKLFIVLILNKCVHSPYPLTSENYIEIICMCFWI